MIFRLVSAAALLIAVLIAPACEPAMAAGTPTPASASIDSGCLSAGAIQDALASKQALRLADIRHKLQGDIVRADLCRNNGKLAYLMTVLTPEGVVRRVSVDASSGEMVYLRPR